MPHPIAAADLQHPLIRRVVLHVLNKYKKQIVKADGSLIESKKKWRATETELLERYGLAIPKGVLKAANAKVTLGFLSF